jgi:arylsulfatase A-like enzyme
MMQRRDFLATLTGGLLASEAAAQSKTNFVFILADDLGCYGNSYYATPNLDRLATQGARFTNAYAACPARRRARVF